MGENLYIETAASGAPSANTPGTNGLGILNQGYVETSNVNVDLGVLAGCTRQASGASRGHDGSIGASRPVPALRSGCSFKFRDSPVAALDEVLDSLFPCRPLPVQGKTAFGPPLTGLPVLLLLLPYCHLPVRVQQRDLAPLGHEGRADAFHLRVMAGARLVVLGQS